MPTVSQISVFDYLDYRAYLRDYYVEQKQEAKLSYRGFAALAGLKSPNYLKLVIDGQRGLTSEMAERFARAMALSGDSLAYFKSLVQFNQVRSTSERTEHYAKLTGFHRYRGAQLLEQAQAACHSTWYIPAIRELVASKKFKNDPKWIAAHLVPPITVEEAARAIDTLLELGLLKREGKRLVQGEALVTTGAETAGMHIASYHRTMMARAAASIDTVDRANRDISSVTLCVGPDGLRRIKERVQRFRRELLELSVLEDDPQQVIQLNFQLFPLSMNGSDD